MPKCGEHVPIVIVFPGGVEVDGVAVAAWVNGDNGEYGYTLYVPNCHAHFNGKGRHVPKFPELPESVRFSVHGCGMLAPNMMAVNEALLPRKEKVNA